MNRIVVERFMELFLLQLPFIILAAAPLAVTTKFVITPPSSFRPLQHDRFWVSSKGLYTFGFKPLPSPSNSSSLYLLCIWRTPDPHQTVLWWPSLSDPSLDPSVTASGTLLYSANGTLQLYRSNGSSGESPIWTSSNSSSSKYAEMADTGNLKLLLQLQDANNSSEQMVWQSFVDPRNTLIGLANLDLASYRTLKTPLLRSKTSNESSYVPGSFSLVPDSSSSTDSYLNFQLHAMDAFHKDYTYLYANLQIAQDSFAIISDHDGVKDYSSSSGRYNVSDQRLTLDEDGNLRVYVWDESSASHSNQSNSSSESTAGSAVIRVGSWKQEREFLQKCSTGSPCGPFGICSDDSNHSVNCSCPSSGDYFRAKSSDGDWSQGCAAMSTSNYVSATNYNCTGRNATISNTNYTVAYLTLPRTDYYYFDLRYEDVKNEDECKSLCTDACDCLAATYLSNTKKCYTKKSETGYLMNGLVADAHTTFLKVMVPAQSRHGSKQQRWNYIVIPLALMGSVTAIFVMINRYRRRRRGNSAAGRGGPIRYAYEEIVEATGDFGQKLGEGGFGTVYKGKLRMRMKNAKQKQKKRHRNGDGDENWNGFGAEEEEEEEEEVAVAVKVLKLKEESGGGSWGTKDMQPEQERQFRAEVGTLGMIHHANLVRLLGYCVEEDRRWSVKKRVLVYELVEGGSLDKYLLSPSPWPSPSPWTPKLEWDIRLSIALGTARGLAYLHHACVPPIIHCDIKPQNVLLHHNVNNVGFTPKVADFGFAKHLLSSDQSTLIVSRKCGTHGYMAPEWFRGGAITSKVDVFSFGKLLLELVHGFKLSHEQEDGIMKLSEWAFLCISQDALLPYGGGATDDETMDPRARHRGAHQKLMALKVGLWCIQPLPGNRPAMNRVVQLLENVRDMS